LFGEYVLPPIILWTIRVYMIFIRTPRFPFSDWVESGSPKFHKKSSVKRLETFVSWKWTGHGSCKRPILWLSTRQLEKEERRQWLIWKSLVDPSPLSIHCPGHRRGTINRGTAGQDKPQFLERRFFMNFVEEIDDGLVVNNVGCWIVLQYCCSQTKPGAENKYTSSDNNRFNQPFAWIRFEGFTLALTKWTTPCSRCLETFPGAITNDLWVSSSFRNWGLNGNYARGTVSWN